MTDEIAILRLEGDASSAAKALDTTQKKLVDLATQSAKTNRVLTEGSKDFTKQSSKAVAAIDDQTQALQRQEKQLRDNAAASKSVSFGTEQLGDISSGSSAFSGALSAFGSSPLGEAGMIVSDITGALEYVPKLGSAIGDMGRAVSASTGPLGALASGISTIVPGLGAAGAGLAAAAIPLAAIAAVTVGFGAAISALTDIFNQGGEIATRYAEANREIQLSIADGLTSSGAQEQIDALTAQIDAEKAAIASNQNYLDQASKALNDQLGIFGGLANALSNADNAVIDTINTSQDSIKDAEAKIARLKAALESGALDANDLKEAEAKLATSREQHRAVLGTLEEQERSLTRASEERASQLESSRKLSDSRAAEDLALSQKRTQEDLDRALEAEAESHKSNLVSIEKAGSDKIEALRTELATKQTGVTSLLNEAANNRTASLLKVEKKYQDDAEKAAKGFAKRRKAIEQSYQDKINNAERDLDVRAFIDAQDEKRDALQALNDEERDATDERSAQLEDERAQINDAYKERVSQIQAELQEFTTATNARIEAEKQLTAQALIDAETAYQDELTEDAELRRIQDERDAETRRIQQERQAEDRRIQDEASRLQLEQQLLDIETKRLAEVAALQSVVDKAYEISSALTSTETPETPELVPYDEYIASLDSPTASIFSLPSRDSGGPGVAGQAYLIGRGAQPEIFVPQTSGSFLPNADRLNGGVTVNITGNSFGEFTTQADLDALGLHISRSVAQAIQQSSRGTT